MVITYEGVFAESPEVKLTAQKKPTSFAGPSLVTETTNESIADTTQYIGTKFRIWGHLLEAIDPYPGLPGKTVKIMRKINNGAYAVFDTLVTDSTGHILKTYTLADVGVNTFKLVFDGDALYSGCSKEAKTLAQMRPR